MTADAVAHLRDDQSARWRRGDRVPAEHYLDAHPGLSDEDRLVLVAGELALRWECGERPTAAEYAERFPAFAADLAVQFELRPLVDGPFAPTPSGPAARHTPAERPHVPGYDLHEEIGRGGWGVVYRATHRRLGRPVAVKVVRGGVEPDRAVRSLDEARLMAKLDHPHALRVYEVGPAAGGLFLALELADGGSLADRLAAGPLPPTEAAELVAAVASAAAAAHARGIVHRDIKPSNVLLLTNAECGFRNAESMSQTEQLPPDSGRHSALRNPHSALVPKLADFGLAKQLDAGPGVTATGQVLGTPQYMAPEQAGGGAVGPPADVYALGAVLYECLTGRPPLLAASPLALLRQIQDQVPVGPRTLDPTVPVDLATVAMKCLEKEPGRRYPSAAELAADLRRFLRGEPVTARPVAAWERAGRWARRHPREAALGGLAVGLLLALAAGSVAAAVLLKRWGDAAVAAKQEAEQHALDAGRLVAAQTREAGQIGQRAAGLEVIRRRVAATPPAARTPELLLALRSEAAACLTAADFAPTAAWPVGMIGFGGADVAPGQPDRYAATDPATGDTVIAGDPPGRLPAAPGYGRLRQFSPDGRVLVEACLPFGGSDSARLQGWDWAAGRRLFDVPLGLGGLRVAFHPDGRRLLVAVAGDFTIRVLDRHTGAELGRSPPRFRGVALALHPDGRRLAVTEPLQPVVILDWADGWRELARVPAADAPVVAWSPDGRHLAAMRDGEVVLWDADTGARRSAPGPQLSMHMAVAFADAGTLVTSSRDEFTQLWEVPGLRPLVRLPGRLVRALDGRTVVTADDTGATRYGRADAGEFRRLAVRATAAVPSPDGALVAVNDAGGPTLLAADTLAPVARLGLDECGPVAFDPAGGRLATFGRYSYVQVWPLAAGRVGPPASAPLTKPPQPVTILPQHLGRAVGWFGGRLLAGDNREGRVAALDPAGGPATVLAGAPMPTAVAGSPDGRWVAAASDVHPHLSVWAADGRKAFDRGGFTAAAFSPAGDLFAAAGRPGVAVYRAGDWAAPAWQAGPEVVADGAATAVAVRPDGRVLAAPVALDRVGLFDAATGDRLLDLRVTVPGPVSGLAFAPDGGRLYVTRLMEAVEVWDLRAVAARLADLGLGHPADALPPAGAVPPTGPLTVDRKRPDGREWPADHWARQWMRMAGWEALQGRYPDAVHNASTALGGWPAGPAFDRGRAEAHAQRGGYHRVNGVPAAAAADWREALRLDPTRGDMAVRLAELLLAAGDPTGAAAVLAAVPADKRDADWRQAMARAEGRPLAAAAGGLAGW